ncbi:hypothetical protein SESBI_22745 [Sesbania bispinosa]|nr:hypothetical protein SESBI_22745 [Sesbania bispinosa]
MDIQKTIQSYSCNGGEDNGRCRPPSKSHGNNGGVGKRRSCHVPPVIPVGN